MNSGTTATVCLLRDGVELVVANVGDSRALLCREGQAVRLTIDHDPENEKEVDRIKKLAIRLTVLAFVTKLIKLLTIQIKWVDSMHFL